MVAKYLKCSLHQVNEISSSLSTISLCAIRTS